MTRTVDEAVEWVRAHPRRTDGDDWNGWCQALVWNAGGFKKTYMTATAARKASRLIVPSSLPIEKVPDGWLLHWAFVGKINGQLQDYGHIAIKVGAKALMASSYCTQMLGANVGFITAADYDNRSGHAYLGASPDMGGEYLAGISRSVPTGTTKAKTHVVTTSENLTTIAKRYGTRWDVLYNLNRKAIGPDPDAIKIGMKLALP